MARALKAALLGCAIGMMGLNPSPSHAQGACLPLSEFERQAYGQYKESPIHYGTASNGWTMTVWVSEGGGNLDDGRDLPGWKGRMPAGGRYGLDRCQFAQGQR
jgi:hypothetical protein